MGGPPFGALLTAIEDNTQNLFQPGGIEQALLQMLGDQIVQPFHRYRAAFAAGIALPGCHGTGVITIAPGFSGAYGHGAAAVRAKADPGEHCWAADDLGWRDLGITRFEVRLNGIECFAVDQRWDGNGNDLIGWLQGLGFAALVELVAANIGRPSQYPMDRAHAPAPARAGVDFALVEVLDDGLDAHAAGYAVALKGQLESQPHRVGVERIDFQLLLDLGPALLRIHDPIADRRQRAVPKALPCILLQGSQCMFGVFLGLVFVEERHDLPHHDVHRIVAQLLRHGDEAHAVFRQLPDVKFQLEMVAEEPAEGMDDHHVESCGLCGARLHHLLELRPAVVGRGGARLHISFDQLVTARSAIGFALLALIRDRHVMLGLPRGRNAKIKGGAKGNGGCHAALSAF